MNSYQLLQNKDCDIEIHNTQQEKKWLKKKRILEQKKETSANMERISQITIALNEYQERINPKPKVTKPKVTKHKNDSNNFLEREFQKNKKYWENLPISYDTDLSVKAKEEREREQRDNIIQKEIRRKRKIYKNNIKLDVFNSWAKETTDEIEYKINQKMKWVMYKKRIYILKIYLYGWKKRCEIIKMNIKMNIKMKIVRNRVICVNHFTMWKNMLQQTCPICIGPIQDKYVTSCNHEFCKSCISKWLCTKQNCPMCREKIEPIESVIENGPLLDEMAITSERIYRQDLWRMLISGHNLFRSSWGETIFRPLYNHMGYTSADFEMSDFSRDSFWYDVHLRYNMLLGSGTIRVGMSPNTRDCFTNLYNIVLEYRRLYPGLQGFGLV